MTSVRRGGWGVQTELVYAGFSARLVAKLIDFGVIMGFMMILSVGVAMFVSAAAAGGPDSGAGSVIVVVFIVWYAFCLFAPIAYNAHWVAQSGATIGKKAMGLKVVRANGKNVSTGQAWGRAFADLLSQMTMYIGYLLVVFDDEKRSLHDHVCGTRVICSR